MASNIRSIRRSVRALIATTAVALFGMTVPAQAVTLEELARQLEDLKAQNASLQQKVDKLEAAQAQQSSQVQQQAQAVEKVRESVKTAATTSAAPESPESTTIGSYGEIGYTRPLKSTDQTNVNIQRAVIFLGHRFDDSTRFQSEFEWENAITSYADSGEAEVEQLYIEHTFKNGLIGTGGLYLMPAGLINQHHEPTAYYGVFRPDVDTKIIPSTWREVGLALAGNTDIGLSWEGGVSTDQNLSGWDPASDEGRVRGPLQAIHGEGQFAKAHDVAVHASLNYRAPGVLLGASAFTGKIGQHQRDFPGNDARVLLWEIHGRYEPGNWDVAGEYARGTISNTDALNMSFLENTPNPTLVPSLFYGGYVQVAYRFFQEDYFKLTPFTRYEILNTAAEFGNLGGSLGIPRSPNEKIWTAGLSFFIGNDVVLKADYRRYKNDQFPSASPPGWTKGNSLNLGLGYSF
jgi:hypothetical protein